jgi:hypothetical protein
METFGNLAARRDRFGAERRDVLGTRQPPAPALTLPCRLSQSQLFKPLAQAKVPQILVSSTCGIGAALGSPHLFRKYRVGCHQIIASGRRVRGANKESPGGPDESRRACRHVEVGLPAA